MMRNEKHDKEINFSISVIVGVVKKKNNIINYDKLLH